MNAIERLRSVLCGADGNIVINGSDADRALVEQSLDEIETALQQQGDAATPAARWRVNGEPDPHAAIYDGERSSLAGGDMTDDEVANAVYLDPSVVNLTIAKERIRWLSRKLFTHPPKSVVSGAVLDTIALRTMRECWDAAEYTVSRSQARAKIQNIIRAALESAVGVKS